MKLPDAEVTVGPVELEVQRPELDGRFGDAGWIRADRTAAVVRLTGVATFGIEQGRRVVVEPEEGAPREVVRAWFDGLVAVFVLAQRGSFALHANLVEIGGIAVAIAGGRAAGKTTTSLLLASRGARLLGDDVVALTSTNGSVVQSTTGRDLRIDRETATAVGLEVADAERRAPSGKVTLVQPPSEPGPLDAVVVLAEAPVNSIESRRLSGADAVQAIHANAHRLPLLRRLWAAEVFEWASAVATRVPVHAVRRPGGRWSGDAVAAAVEAVAAERGAS